MFHHTTSYIGSDPRQGRERVAKIYHRPKALSIRDMVEIVGRSGCDVRELELDRGWRGDRERVPLEGFDASRDALRDVVVIRAEIGEPGLQIEIHVENDAMGLVYMRRRGDDSPGPELDELLGRAAEELLRERGELTAFLETDFRDELDLDYYDGLSGWRMWKVYRLRKGLDIAPAEEEFLRDRPDEKRYDWLHRYPSYLIVGEHGEAERFAEERPDLIRACGSAGIHVISGSCESFWDSFDKKDYSVEVEEHPGSADDAATYGYVKLCCEDGPR